MQELLTTALGWRGSCQTEKMTAYFWKTVLSRDFCRKENFVNVMFEEYTLQRAHWLFDQSCELESRGDRSHFTDESTEAQSRWGSLSPGLGQVVRSRTGRQVSRPTDIVSLLSYISSGVGGGLCSDLLPAASCTAALPPHQIANRLLTQPVHQLTSLLLTS